MPKKSEYETIEERGAYTDETNELLAELQLELTDVLKARAKEGIRALQEYIRTLRRERAEMAEKQLRIDECFDAIIKAYNNTDEVALEVALKTRSNIFKNN